MQTTSGNTTIDYSVTRKGNFMQVIKRNGATLIKSTPNVLTFLRLMITGDPAADAQDHLRSQDARPYEFEHSCVHCSHGFDSGFGVLMEGKKLCHTCIREYRYFDYFRHVENLPDREIYELTYTEL